LFQTTLGPQSRVTLIWDKQHPNDQANDYSNHTLRQTLEVMLGKVSLVVLIVSVVLLLAMAASWGMM
jgi:hypothetical protein